MVVGSFGDSFPKDFLEFVGMFVAIIAWSGVFYLFCEFVPVCLFEIPLVYISAFKNWDGIFLLIYHNGWLVVRVEIFSHFPAELS